MAEKMTGIVFGSKAPTATDDNMLQQKQADAIAEREAMKQKREAQHEQEADLQKPIQASTEDTAQTSCRTTEVGGLTIVVDDAFKRQTTFHRTTLYNTLGTLAEFLGTNIQTLVYVMSAEMAIEAGKIKDDTAISDMRDKFSKRLLAAMKNTPDSKLAETRKNLKRRMFDAM